MDTRRRVVRGPRRCSSSPTWPLAWSSAATDVDTASTLLVMTTTYDIPIMLLILLANVRALRARRVGLL